VTATSLEARNLARLRAALIQLVGAGPVKQRLCEASLRHLRDVDPAGLSSEAADMYRQLMDSLSAVPATGGLGPVGATVRKMSELEAASCATRVLDIYVALSANQAREGAPSSQRQLRLVGDE
jgi:hypothetical protein